MSQPAQVVPLKYAPESSLVPTDAAASDRSEDAPFGPFLSTKTAATYCDVSRGCIKSLYRDGLLPGFKLNTGGVVARQPLRFRRIDLDRLLIEVQR